MKASTFCLCVVGLCAGVSAIPWVGMWMDRLEYDAKVERFIAMHPHKPDSCAQQFESTVDDVKVWVTCAGNGEPLVHVLMPAALNISAAPKVSTDGGRLDYEYSALSKEVVIRGDFTVAMIDVGGAAIGLLAVGGGGG